MYFKNLKKNEEIKSLRCFKLEECLAKTFHDGKNANVPGRDVLSHCLIVGLVARKLLNRIPSWLKESLYSSQSELIAASHDVGKVCPTFQEKIRRGRHNSVDYKPNSYPGLERTNPEREEKWGYHAGLSQVTLSHCEAGQFIPEIVGQHHGYSPPLAILKSLNATDDCFGGPEWQTLRENLIEELKKALKVNWPYIADEKQARLLSGLTTVADWIGSTARFDDPKKLFSEEEIESAVDEAGFFALRIKKGLSFKQIFECQPRVVQQDLIEACKTPGVYILEAPMGIGKTEAALYAAYKLLESEQSAGIYFALPTQLTSDKIFERINNFLDKILPEDVPYRKPILAHSQAKLKILDLGEEGKPGGSWFSGHKRELLAPFGVGTIDQALMAVMNVKHGFVRAFGLAGKVVILDEIHSYDAYTGTIIDDLIDNLIAWNCTVIILSATLTKERRQKLLSLQSEELKNHYPLISLKTKEKFTEIEVVSEADSKVELRLCGKNIEAFEEVLERAKQGQQVLWIENTVQEAQEIYKGLAEVASENGIKCGLLHSRFTRSHRNQIEADWIELFGKNGGSDRLAQGRILIGTQILEQSLDIDADFLVTRLCPIDMFFQRLGRLWRHKNLSRSATAKPEAWILSSDYDKVLEDPKNELGKSYYVYSPYYLLRTLEQLMPLSGGSIRLPDDIRKMIELTYATREETGLMQKLKRELDERKETLQRLALGGITKGGITPPDDWAPTRYSEQDTCELLIIREIKYEKSGVSLTFINDEKIVLPSSGLLPQIKKKISLKLHQHIVKIGIDKAPSQPSSQHLEWMKQYLYVSADKKNILVRIAKLNTSEELVSLEGASFSGAPTYSQVLGYEIKE